MIKTTAVLFLVLVLALGCIDNVGRRVKKSEENMVSESPGVSAAPEIKPREPPKFSLEDLRQEPIDRIFRKTSGYCQYIGLENENGGYGGFISIRPDGTVTGGYEGDPPIEIIWLMEKATDEKIDYYLNFSLLTSPDKYWFVKASIDRTEYLSWLEKRITGAAGTPFTVVRESLPDDTVVDGLSLEDIVWQKIAETTREESVENFFKAYVLMENVFLKNGPFDKTQNVAAVRKGEAVEVLSRSIYRVQRQENNSNWFKVKISTGRTGWLYGADLEFFNIDPKYPAQADLRLIQKIDDEFSSLPDVAGDTLVGMVNYRTIAGKNTEIGKIYLFDKYILMYIGPEKSFSVFEYNPNLSFNDYPVFGNRLVEVDNMEETLYPLGIWNDHLLVANRLISETFDDYSAELIVYNLDNGQPLRPGIYYNAVKSDNSGKLFFYQYDRVENDETYYREYSFDFSSGALEPTGETKTYVYADLQ
jgi:hypothetical protein